MPTIPVLEKTTKSVDFILKNIKVFESSAVLMMVDMGKTDICDSLLRNTEAIKNYDFIKNFTITNDSEIIDVLTDMGQMEKTTLYILQIVLDHDVTDFINAIEAFRYRYQEKFVVVLIANLKPIRSSFVNGSKILTKSVHICSPLCESDTNKIIDFYAERYGVKMKQKIRKNIFTFSGGNIGLIKSIFLYIFNNNIEVLETDKLLEDYGIEVRLKTIFQDIDESIWKNFFDKKNDIKEKRILTDFGFIKDNKIFTPLLEKFIFNSLKIDILAEDILSSTELVLYKTISKQDFQFMSRDQIAEIIWEKNWREKYSDWAIDQFMYRFKKKLKSVNPNFSIITKRGKGFIVKSK